MAIITRDTAEVIRALRESGVSDDQIKTVMLALDDMQKNPISVYESFGKLSNSLIQWLCILFLAQTLIIALIIKY